MKNITLTAAIVAVLLPLVLSSCNKQFDPSFNPVQNDNSARHSLVVSLGGSAAQVSTKATAASGEAAVNSLQVFAFNGNFLDAYIKSSSSTATLTCTEGTRAIYAVVNAPDLSSITTPSALKAKVVDLSSNSASSFTMFGSNTSVSIPASESVSIDVERLVSRVVVKKVTTDFDAPALAALTLSIDKIYLVNAAGTASLDLSAAPSKWYNEAKNKGELSALLYDAPAKTLANKASYSTVHYFYAMPNPATSKKTLLVLETTLGTQKYYYPIELPALKANHSYEIAGITIKRPGSDSPDSPVESEAVSFSVSVKDWVSESIDETII